MATERDLVAAEQAAPDDRTLGLLRRSFVQSSHVFNRCDTRNDLEATLRSRLQHLSDLAGLKDSFAEPIPAAHLRVAAPLPDLPHPALVRTVTGRTVPIWSCAISPDASFIVSGADDGTVTVWDTATGAERVRLTGHTSAVRGCAISADGTFIVTAGYDRRVRIWDAATGALRHVLLGHTDGVTGCAISIDGSFIVTSSLDETLRIWDTTSWTLRQTLATEWRPVHGGWLRRQAPVGHSAAVWACAISRDGRFIASASSDQTVKIWDAATGEERRTLIGHAAAVNGCAFSPDGSSIATVGADRTVRIWDRDTGAERLAIDGHAHVVNRCAFGPDGTWLVSVSADGTLKTWDAATGASRGSNVGHTDALTDCAVASTALHRVVVARRHPEDVGREPAVAAGRTSTRRLGASVRGEWPYRPGRHCVGRHDAANLERHASGGPRGSHRPRRCGEVALSAPPAVRSCPRRPTSL